MVIILLLLYLKEGLGREGGLSVGPWNSQVVMYVSMHGQWPMW